MTVFRLLVLSCIAVCLTSRGAQAEPAPATRAARRAAASMPTTFEADPQKDTARAAANAKEHIGDSADDAGSIATDLSPAISRPAVLAAMRKVADWELARYQPYFGNSWTWSTLYAGLIATSQASGDSKYQAPVVAMGEKYQWKLGRRLEHADDQCIGQVYLDLYLEHPDDKMIAATRAQFDQLMAKGGENKWTWCDALFMGPPIWARLAKATGEQKYIDYMNTNWWRATDALYDRDEHLFFRDAKYLPRRDLKGRKVFWSRGNGWVMGGLARVLQCLPADHADRPKYVAMLNEMSARLLALRDDEGLWHASLLDPETFKLPETSGSALILYGMAWGVNEGALDRATYEPAIEKGWKGLLSHVYSDGRFGCVQQTGDAPALYKPTSTYNYGVGAFLLAGSEVCRLGDVKH